jgi:hypothetical protein
LRKKPWRRYTVMAMELMLSDADRPRLPKSTTAKDQAHFSLHCLKTSFLALTERS